MNDIGSSKEYNHECVKYIDRDLVHFHPNNCCGIIKYNNITIPKLFECTYIRKKYVKKYHIIQYKI